MERIEENEILLDFLHKEKSIGTYTITLLETIQKSIENHNTHKK